MLRKNIKTKESYTDADGVGKKLLSDSDYWVEKLAKARSLARQGRIKEAWATYYLLDDSPHFKTFKKLPKDVKTAYNNTRNVLNNSN